jgi:hypothetical protein
MAIGDPGKEQFRDAVVEFRNLDIAVGLDPLFRLREQLVGNDDLRDRSGIDDVTRDHILGHLKRCDDTRRRITYNPEGADIGTQLAAAIDPEGTIEGPTKPFAGETVQSSSGGIFQLPWDISGGDDNIPLRSTLDIRNGFAHLILEAVDRCIVQWTRLESRWRTQFITINDSMRMYQRYQRVYDLLMSFGGNDNRTDIAQGVRATEEPRGHENAPNRKTESAGNTAPQQGNG